MTEKELFLIEIERLNKLWNVYKKLLDRKAEQNRNLQRQITGYNLLVNMLSYGKSEEELIEVKKCLEEIKNGN